MEKDFQTDFFRDIQEDDIRPVTEKDTCGSDNLKCNADDILVVGEELSKDLKLNCEDKDILLSEEALKEENNMFFSVDVSKAFKNVLGMDANYVPNEISKKDTTGKKFYWEKKKESYVLKDYFKSSTGHTYAVIEKFEGHSVSFVKVFRVCILPVEKDSINISKGSLSLCSTKEVSSLKKIISDYVLGFVPKREIETCCFSLSTNFPSYLEELNFKINLYADGNSKKGANLINCLVHLVNSSIKEQVRVKDMYSPVEERILILRKLLPEARFKFIMNELQFYLKRSAEVLHVLKRNRSFLDRILPGSSLKVYNSSFNLLVSFVRVLNVLYSVLNGTKFSSIEKNPWSYYLNRELNFSEIKNPYVLLSRIVHELEDQSSDILKSQYKGRFIYLLNFYDKLYLSSEKDEVKKVCSLISKELNRCL